MNRRQIRPPGNSAPGEAIDAASDHDASARAGRAADAAAHDALADREEAAGARARRIETAKAKGGIDAGGR